MVRMENFHFIRKLQEKERIDKVNCMKNEQEMCDVPELVNERFEHGKLERDGDELRTEKTIEAMYKAFQNYKKAAEFWAYRVKLCARDQDVAFKRTALLYGKMAECLRSSWMEEKIPCKDAPWKAGELEKEENALLENVIALKKAIIKKMGTWDGLNFLRDTALEYNREINEEEEYPGDMLFRFQWLFDIFIWPDHEDSYRDSYRRSPQAKETLTLHSEHDSMVLEIRGWVEMYGRDYLLTSSPLRIYDNSGRQNLEMEENSQSKEVVLWEVTDSDKPEYSLRFRELEYTPRTKEIYKDFEETQFLITEKRQIDVRSGQILAFRKIKRANPAAKQSPLEKKFSLYKKEIVAIIQNKLWDGEVYWYC